MEFVVDVQGFKKPHNKFVFKELAVTTLGDDSQLSVFLFEPPFAWGSLPAKYKSENLWLERNYHGISWNSGEIPYYEFEETLRNILQDASKIHVKGLEKQRWLQKYFSNVYNIEDLGCPSLQKLYAYLPCDNHDCWESHVSPCCAAKNVVALNNWLSELNKSSAMEGRDEVDGASVEFIPDYYRDLQRNNI